VHPNIFVSASADWTVKVWDHAKKAPVLTFDLGQAVGDAAWAPYASTVFAAITTDGIVHVYDLNVNRNDRICSQKVVKRAKLTHLAFNMRNPILNVGDDRGGVNCLICPRTCVASSRRHRAKIRRISRRKMLGRPSGWSAWSTCSTW